MLKLKFRNLLLNCSCIFLSFFCFAEGGASINYVAVDFTSAYDITPKKFNIRPHSFNSEPTDEQKEALNIIDEKGVEIYLSGVLTGIYPQSLPYFSEKINAFDLAVLHKVSKSFIEQFRQAGFTHSKSFWRLRFLSQEPSLSVFEEFVNAGNDIDDLFISFDSYQRLTIGGYAIVKQDYNLLEKFLLADGQLMEGDLVDIEKLTLARKVALSEYISLNEYQRAFERQQTKREAVVEELKARDDFVFTEVASLSLNNNWAPSIDHIDTVIREAKLQCSQGQLIRCVDRLDPVVAEILATRELRNTLKQLKITYINVSEFEQKIEPTSLYYDANSRQLLYEEKLTSNTLHQLEFETYKGLISEQLYRLENIAYIISDNKMKTQYLFSTLPNINKDTQLGKNLSYYISLISNDKAYMQWFFKSFGVPVVEYGLSSISMNLISGINDEKSRARLNILKELGFKKSHHDQLLEQTIYGKPK